MQLIKVRGRFYGQLNFEDRRQYEYGIVTRVKGKAIAGQTLKFPGG
jgi:hypothetical protein